MSTGERSYPATLYNLQYLRAIAAMMVIAYHALESTGRLTRVEAFPSFNAGQGGVDIFFVLSGFIIWRTTRPGDGPVSFGLRRIKRIVPLYWALTFMLAGAALLPFGLTETTRFALDHFLASLAFVPWPHPATGTINPLIFVGWTLNFEMAFYLLFALCLAFAPVLRGAIVLSVLTFFAVLGTGLSTGTILDFYFAPIVLEFGFGVALAMVYAVMPRLPAWFWGLAVAVGFALMLGLAETGTPRILWAGVPSALIVAGAIFAERDAPHRPLVMPALLGAASYSIYLSHVMVLPTAQILWEQTMPAAVGPFVGVYLAVVTAICTVGGVATYLGLEIPLSHIVDRAEKALRRRSSRQGPSLMARYRRALAP